MDFEWVNEISVIYIGLQFKWYSSLVGGYGDTVYTITDMDCDGGVTITWSDGYAVDYTVDELTNYLEDTTIKEL